MSISIIIPTKNEQDHLPHLLENLKNQTLQPNEIIISDKSTDNTREIAKKFGCKIVEGDNQGRVGRARNNGVEVATSDILLFIDADITLPNNHFLEDFVRLFAEKSLDLCTFYIIPNGNNTPFGINLIAWLSWGVFINFQKLLGSLLKRPIDEMELAFAIKKEVFDKAGGFNRDAKMSEGQMLMSKVFHMGYKYSPIPLVVITSPRRTVSLNLRQLGWLIIYNFSKLMGKKTHAKVRKKYGEIYWDLDYDKDKSSSTSIGK